MAISYKNFWSLNTDEAVVTGILREYFRKKVEVMMPVNAQLKDVDLVLLNLKNKKSLTIQVKGSRAFEPQKREVEKFGAGSTGWFFLHKKVVFECTADYFIFLIYVINVREKKGRREIEPHTITIPTKKLIELTERYKILHTRFSYYFWVNPKKKTAFDFRDEKKKGRIELDQYLDERGLEQLERALE